MSLVGADKFESSSSSDRGSRLPLLDMRLRLLFGETDRFLLKSPAASSLIWLALELESGGGAFQPAALAVSKSLGDGDGLKWLVLDVGGINSLGSLMFMKTSIKRSTTTKGP